MRLLVKDSQLSVVDEVFENNVFYNFWNYFNSLEFAYRSVSGWQKVWRINDGQILSGISYYHSQSPFNSSIDWIDQVVTSLAKKNFEDIVGKEGEDWNEIMYTPYIYPAGTKISWHDDGCYTGACIFYPHLEWSPNWGGELFVAKTPPPQECEFKGSMDMINRDFVSPLLNKYGMGTYVSPLPNRMVFTSGSVWHSINRVDQAAGDKVRCSIVAFFMKDKIN